MPIPTEPIGSIPRPPELIAAIEAQGDGTDPSLDGFGVHTCPGGDRDSTHSADVNYSELLPSLFQLNVSSFYGALAGEADRPRVLGMIRDHLQPHHRVFVGVVAPIDLRIDRTKLAERALGVS